MGRVFAIRARSKVGYKLENIFRGRGFRDCIYKKKVVDLDSTKKVARLAYLGLSTVKNLSDLMVEPTSFERLQSVRK